MKKTYSYDPSIYTKEAVLEAIEDFSDTCPIEMISDGELAFELEDDSDDTLFYEFMNYVISL